MEDDEDIFKNILEPLIVLSVGETLKKQRLDSKSSTDDDEDVEDVAMLDVVPRNRFCK